MMSHAEIFFFLHYMTVLQHSAVGELDDDLDAL